MLSSLSRLISETIQSLSSLDFTPEITPPPKSDLGEYCFGVFSLAKPLGKSPQMIASEIAAALSTHTETFTQVNTIGGYVNFSLTDRVWGEIFSRLVSQRLSPEKKSETIIVDYIGANVGKPLHIGHICTPSIGQTIGNVYRHLGYRVIGDSHFGDWGGIFGKIIAMGRREHGENIESLKQQVETEGVDYLLSLYQRATRIIEQEKNESSNDFDEQCREAFKKLSQGERENVELWKLFTSISIAETEKKLDLLNVHADYNIGESFYEGLGLPRPNGEDYPNLEYTMKDIVGELIEKKIATQNEDGSVGVIFSEESKLPSCVLQKRDGTGLYLTSDLGSIRYRMTNGWNPSRMIYCVDVRQQTHLRQAFAIARAAWGLEGVEMIHASNGFIRLREGAMSTRHGTVIFLEELIEEGVEKTKSILTEKGKNLDSSDIKKITIGAIKYSYLMQDREKDVVFDWEKALAFEGHSGPYIQYATVRARKILHDQTLTMAEGMMNYELRITNYDKSLIQKLSEIDDVIDRVAETYKPHHLALYAYELAVTFNAFYVHTPKILDEQDETLKQSRLTLIHLTVERLTLAMSLLGIEIPSEM